MWTIEGPEIKTYVFDMPHDLNTQEMETPIYHKISLRNIVFVANNVVNKF
jgi:hypothetical protein